MYDRLTSEKELIESCFSYFRQIANHVFLEVPIFSSSADMVVLEANSITAIEFKLNHWQRAIGQARKHVLAVDYAYVCVPKPKTFEACKRIEASVSASGLGLFYYENTTGFPEVTKAVDAPHSTVIWQVAKRTLLKFLDTEIAEVQEGR